jgi:hypothetical protein
MTDPDTPERATHIEGPEVRAGETSGRVRYVLGVSLLLAVVILSLIVWGPVLFHK